MRSYKRFLGETACIAIGCLGTIHSATASAQTATAQPQTSSEDANAGEIIVTAQRRQQSLQDVPISVAVSSGETLRQTQVTSFNDLGNRLSGVKVNTGGASDSLNIRGVGSGFNGGFEQSVATFIDGIYIARSQATRAGFLDLERIEVLKGPQSTYFGSNAIAGALSAVTRKPGRDFEGFANALYSPSDGEYNLEAAVGGPLTDTLSGRVAGRLSGMNGYIRNLRLDDKGPRKRDAQARVALRYQTPGLLDVNLRVDYAHYNDLHAELQEVLNCPEAPGYGPITTGCVSVLSGGNADNKLNYRTSTGDSFFKLDSVSSALTAALTLGNHTLTSTTGFYYQKIHRFNGSNLVNVPLTGITQSSGLPVTNREKYHTISQELRLESDKGGFLEYTLGLYYDKSDLDISYSYGFYFAPFAARLDGLVPAGTPLAQRVGADQEQSNRSLFGAATLNLTDALQLNLGARYSSIKKSISRETFVGVGDNFGEFDESALVSPAAFTLFTSTVGFVAGQYPIRRRTDDRFMPSVNLQYRINRDVMTYLSYTTGFKAGGFAIGSSLDTFGPEKVQSYEAGVKAVWLDRRLTTNLTFFNSRYKDLQESTTIINASGLPQSAIANVGRARSRGIELEVGLRPVDGLSLGANIGYLDATYLRYPNAPCTQLQIAATPVGCTQDLSGSRKAYAPKWSGSVSANYMFGLANDVNVKLGSWLYFTSGYYQQSTIDPLFYQRRYAKLDLRVAIAGPDDRWELAVIAKNVTDKTTASYRAVLLASRSATAIPDRPRSIAIQAMTKF